MDVIFFGVERGTFGHGKIVTRYRGGYRLHATYPTVFHAEEVLDQYRDRHIRFMEQWDRLYPDS